MNYIYLSVLGSLLGTGAIVLVSAYLYFLYREKCLGLWALSWLVFFLRYVALDTGVIPWKDSALGITIYEMLTFLAVLMIVYSTYYFINKPVNRWWLYSTAILILVSIVINLSPMSFRDKLLIPIYACCYAGLWIGAAILRHSRFPSFGRYVTGYAYILLSIINFSTPFIMHGSWMLPWGYALGGLLRIIIAMGTLMLYIEKSRRDLIDKEAQYRELALNAIDVIFHYQILPNKKFKFVSPSVLRMTGYSPEEHYQDCQLYFKTIHSDDTHVFDDLVSGFPSSDKEVIFRLIRKDGTTLWVELKCVPILNEYNQIIALEGILRDITQRKKLEQLSSVVDRMNMIGSMAATVAHEIRNPLTTVRGYLQLLGKRDKYQQDREKFVLMIEELDRANDIIREYLSLSHEKIANLKQESLNRIINSLFPLLQADANSSSVLIIKELSDIPDNDLDENEIRQMILNLVRNGIEAMPAGGKLTIRTTQEEDYVVLSVCDQGSGISQQVLEKLGTPFFTTKKTGTGLGLPLCYKIAQRHNASIKVDTGETGTTFSVHFKKVDGPCRNIPRQTESG